MKIYQFSQQGKRQYQEDSLFISPDYKLFAVCDGVGGSDDGFMASNMVVINLFNLYNQKGKLNNQNDLMHYIYEAIVPINAKNNVSIATTITLLCFIETTAYLFHVGDSRIFHISPMRQKWSVTKDHSFVQELYEAGILTSEQEMKNHPMRNRITKAISSTEPIQLIDIHIKVISDLQQGDLFLLCSDGALEQFTNEEIVKHFSNTVESLESKWEEFRVHCQENSKDNNTAILVKI